MLAEERFESIEIATPETVKNAVRLLGYVVRSFDFRSRRHLTSLSEREYGGDGRKVTTAGVRCQGSGVKGRQASERWGRIVSIII